MFLLALKFHHVITKIIAQNMFDVFELLGVAWGEFPGEKSCMTSC